MLTTSRSKSFICKGSPALSLPVFQKVFPFALRIRRSEALAVADELNGRRPNFRKSEEIAGPGLPMPKAKEAGDSSHHSEEHPAPTLTAAAARIRSRSDPFLVVCHCFSFVSAVAGLLCVAVNAVFAVHAFKNGADIFEGIFRCYAFALALFVAIAETEWSCIMKSLKVLESWIGRGMLQIFVAVMTRAFPDVKGRKGSLVILQDFASYMLIACGLIYMVSGILCIGFLKRQREKQEITREQAARNLEELERRRGELEALLVVRD